ncbi:MAG: polysaccharide deacetylase family protein [Mesorhizobium sp.]
MKSEIDYYRYRPYNRRQKIVWPGGAQIAVWVVPNVEFYEYEPPPSPGRSAYARGTPDIMNYTHKDYGNRIGFKRMADAMEKFGVTGSVSLSVAVCEHFPDIIERCVELGWEIFSHGVYNTRMMYGMTEEQQRALIRDCRDTILAHTGQSMDGWLSPAISCGETTTDILAEEGVKYTLDFYHDDQPTPMRTRAGRIISVPYSLEMNDFPLLQAKSVASDDYAQIIIDQFDQLHREGAEGGTVLCIPLHPYLIGQPHRMPAFEKILGHIKSKDKTWITTGREIADFYLDNYYDAAIAEEGRP